MPGGLGQLAFEADRLAALQDLAIDFRPGIGFRRRDDLSKAFADDVGDPGVDGVGRVGLQVDIVRQGALRTIQELDDAEALVDGLEQGPIARFAVRQRRLGRPALGDVYHRAGDPDAPARRVERAPPLRRQPPDDPVLPADRAEDDIIGRPALRIGGRLIGRGDGRAVLWMKAFIEVGHGDGPAGRDPEHRLGARGPDQLVIDRIDVPEAHLGVLDRQPQPRLGFAQLGVDRLAGRHVAVEDRQARGRRIGPDVEPGGAAVRPGVVVLQPHGRAVRHRRAKSSPEFGALDTAPDVPERPAEDLIAPEVLHSEPLGIDLDDPEVRVDQDEALVHSLEHAAQARLALAEAGDGSDLFGDVVASDENPGDLSGGVPDRLVDHVDDAVAVGSLQADRQLTGDEGLAGRIDFVEQFVEPLPLQLGKGLGHGPPDEAAVTRDLQVSVVDVGVAMLGPRQHGGEPRHLLQGQLLAFALGRQLAARKDLFGGLRAKDQDPAHPVGRGVVVDGAIAVGPVDVLQTAVAGDRDELVLVPGRPQAGPDLVDLRADDVPDLRPDLLGRPPEGSRMALRTDRGAVGVVVEAVARRPPEEVGRMAGVEDQPQRGLQRLGPGLSRAQRVRRPVVGPHKRAHLAAPGQEAGRIGPDLAHSRCAFVDAQARGAGQRDGRPQSQNVIFAPLAGGHQLSRPKVPPGPLTGGPWSLSVQTSMTFPIQGVGRRLRRAHDGVVRAAAAAL